MALERDTYTGPSVLESFHKMEQAQTCRRVVVVAWKASGVGPAGASTSADLGGSSNYSNVIFED